MVHLECSAVVKCQNCAFDLNVSKLSQQFIPAHTNINLKNDKITFLIDPSGFYQSSIYFKFSLHHSFPCFPHSLARQPPSHSFPFSIPIYHIISWGVGHPICFQRLIFYNSSFSSFKQVRLTSPVLKIRIFSSWSIIQNFYNSFNFSLLYVFSHRIINMKKINQGKLCQSVIKNVHVLLLVSL